MSDLKRIVKLAEQLVNQRDAVKELEDELKSARAVMLRLEREDLPELMREVGLEEVRLEDGTLIRVEEDFDAKITDATRTPALHWLEQNGFGGLIKTQVAVSFGRGDKSTAQVVFDELSELYESTKMKEEVHPQTLKAFIREQFRDGAAVPMDLFNVFPYEKAIIKGKK